MRLGECNGSEYGVMRWRNGDGPVKRGNSSSTGIKSLICVWVVIMVAGNVDPSNVRWPSIWSYGPLGGTQGNGWYGMVVRGDGYVDLDVIWWSPHGVTLCHGWGWSRGDRTIQSKA